MNFMGYEDAGFALITGASAGLGAEFARQLAMQGFNLILVARRKDKLQEFASQLQEQYKIKAEVLAADLNKDSDLEIVKDRIKKEPNLDVLINNAGFGTRGDFWEANFDFQLSMLRVHNYVPVQLMRSALEQMVPKNRGVIINLSSLQSVMPAGGSSMYAATKAFIRMFSESVALELKNTKVVIQALCPGFTHTEFHSSGELTDFDASVIPKFMWMTAEEVIKISLASVKKRKVVVIPGAKNKFTVFLMTTWPFSSIAKNVVQSKGKKGKEGKVTKK